ncbi:unnamed protein product [Miscanthus lutarioriparius]|uniref:DNA polymerase delta catalytic subunit n=1 Tax=Miscanthus lutarioriparius TaxID=422564 RepID=A0A811Q0W2_9POAL|nr:unnamed protein product [Miscanthus lutarioriparius]
MSSGGRGGKRRGPPPPALSGAAAKRANPSPGLPQPPPPAAAAAAAKEEDMMDEDVFLDESILAEDEAALLMLQRDEAFASRLARWKRPRPAFQQLEIDYVIGESHKELLPNSSGSAAILRIFGVTREGHSICCQVHGFEPYFYIGCPSGMGPDDISRFHQTLEGRMKESNRSSNVPRFVKRVELVQKQTIMHYQTQQSQPFLKIVVALPTMVASCRGILERGITIEGLGSKSFLTYESNILFALRFMIDCNIVGGNWIELPAGKYRKAARVMSYCQLELDCLYSDLVSHAAEGEYSKMAPFRILSFDIECAGRKGHFPEPTHDLVIQKTSCSVSGCPCLLPENYRLDGITFDSLEEIGIKFFTGSDEHEQFMKLLLSKCNTTTLKRVDITVPLAPVSSEIMEAVERIRSVCHPNSKTQFNVHAREAVKPLAS